jgi:hypothetical protein
MSPLYSAWFNTLGRPFTVKPGGVTIVDSVSTSGDPITTQREWSFTTVRQ